jgi:hypothetical protein
MANLGIDLQPVERARELAQAIVAPVQAYIEAHTTDSVERACLRPMASIETAAPSPTSSSTA